jgi:hypothetical protein
LFERARLNNGEIPGLLVEWANIESDEAVMELTAAETLEETQASKPVARALGNT